MDGRGRGGGGGGGEDRADEVADHNSRVLRH